MRVSPATTLRRLALLLLGTAALFLILIAAGLFDPQPLAPLQSRLPLEALAVPAQQALSQPIPQRPPAVPFTLKLDAALAAGEADSAYGLLLETGTGSTAVLVSPLGYAAVLAAQPGSPTPADGPPQPWAPWPHVQRDTAANEIWLDYDGAELAVRINGEFFWRGPLPGPVTQLSLFVRSFGGPVAVDFSSLQIHAAP